MATELRRVRRDLTLTISLGGLLESPTFQNACRPGLPRQVGVEQALVLSGLDCATLAAAESIVVERPLRDVPMSHHLASGIVEAFNDDPQWDGIFEDTEPVALAIFRPSETYQSPTSTDLQTRRTRTIPSVPGPIETRKRLSQSLLATDCGQLSLGASKLCLQDNPQAREWLGRYRKLPAIPFDGGAKNPKSPSDMAALSNSHAISVKTASHAGKTFFYAVNDSPWPTTAKIVWHANSSCRYAAFDDGSGGSFEWNNGRSTLVRSLAPYEMISGMLTDPAASVESAEGTTTTDYLTRLQDQLATLTQQVLWLKDPAVQTQLKDPGFDLPAGTMSGWQWAREPGVLIERDATIRFSGSHSLKLQSTQPVGWVRSEPIRIPSTGRLSVQVRLHFDAAELPPLRLALEGRLNGLPYYRFAQVSDQAARSISNSSPTQQVPWSSFMLHVDDLPTEGLEELRVRFDLMGPGTVWIDDVSIFHHVFTPEEQVELSRIIALAEFQLRNGNAAQCAHILEGYWPRYLEKHIPIALARIAESPRPPVVPSATTKPRSQNPPGMLQRIRKILPRF